MFSKYMTCCLAVFTIKTLGSWPTISFKCSPFSLSSHNKTTTKYKLLPYLEHLSTAWYWIYQDITKQRQVQTCQDNVAMFVQEDLNNHCTKAHYSDCVEKEMNFFEVIFVTVSWLLIAEPLVQFAPRSQCNLEKEWSCLELPLPTHWYTFCSLQLHSKRTLW